MMWTRRAAVRSAVLRTNGIWPFSRLNRLPYRLALSAFLRTCRAEPAIASVYLRHGLARGDWVPALSDIDLTVIVDDEPRGSCELERLQRFWVGYDRVKRVFPMLGDVELLRIDELDACRMSARGRESRDWKLVAGRDALKPPGRRSPHEESIDGLNLSLLYYFPVFLHRFYERARPSLLGSSEMCRLAQRLLLTANSRCPERPVSAPSPGEHDVASLLRWILLELDEAAAGSLSMIGEPRSGAAMTHSRALPYAHSPSEFQPLVGDETIDSILVAYQIRIIVVKPDVVPERLSRSLDKIRNTFAGDPEPPLVVTARLLDYIVRVYDPFLYTHLREYAEIVYGRDVLSSTPPADSAFADCLFEQIPTLMTFSRSRKLMSTVDPMWYAGREVESAFERALFVRMYLETGEIIPYHATLLGSCRARYGALYERWQLVQEAARRGDVDAARLKAFRLLRTVLGTITQAFGDASRSGVAAATQRLSSVG